MRSISASRLLSRLIVLLIAITGAGELASQQRSEFQEFKRRTWHIQDGLPDQIIQALAQTPDHYLWLGTLKGLFRFDGENFVEYSGQDQNVLRAHGILCLLTAHDGSLWIGTGGGGLLRYGPGGDVRRYTEREGLSHLTIMSLYEGKDGTIWAGADVGVFRLVGDHFDRVDNRPDTFNLEVHSIVGDANGSVWVGGIRLVQYSGDLHKVYVMPREADSLRIKSVRETSDGTLWVGTVDGLYRLGPHDEFVKEPRVSGSIRFLREDSNRRLWIGTVGNGLYVKKGSELKHYLAPSDLPSNTALNLLEDSEGNIWVGTQAGLLRLSRTEMQIAQLPGASDSDFGTVMRDADGAIWICSTHIFRFLHGAIEPYTLPGLGNATVRTMFRGKDGALWVGTNGRGVYHIEKGGRVTRLEVGNNYVRGFLQGTDGSVWIGTDGGVSRWKDGHLDNYHLIPGAPRINITSLEEDASGELWIGTPHGLRLLRNYQFVQEPPTDVLKDQTIWALHRDVEGAMWIGTDSGLYRWKDGVLLHVAVDGLLNTPTVYGILTDNASDAVWISGPTSVIRVTRKDLDQVADADGKHLHGEQAFAVSSDLQAAELYGGMQPSGILGTDGSAWFPTSQGILHILPQAVLPQPELPSMVIDRVLVDGKTVDPASGLELPAGARTLEIFYNPILLSSQSGLEFRRLLHGFDADWSSSTVGRHSFYTNLPPGHYVYEVQAFYAYDPSRTSSATLELRQRAHFYRTSWFAGLCLAILVFLAWAIDQLRTQQIQARYRAVMEERNRLAREIHDTVIQGCTGVSVLLEAASSMPVQEKSEQRRLLDYAREQVKVTIDEARDAVWNLRHSDDLTKIYSDVLHGYATELAQGLDLKLDFQVIGPDRPIAPTIAHESLMAVREAVTNVAIHSKTSRVGIELQYLTSEFNISVCDQGCGFIAEELDLTTGKHYGLLGMRERVEQVGGVFCLKSSPGDGTRLIFSFPTEALR